MKLKDLCNWSSFALSVLLIGVLGMPTASFGQTGASSFSGAATALRGTVLGVSTAIADTGSLASVGDALHASLGVGSVPSLFSAETFHATSVGQVDTSGSEASLSSLSLAVGGNTISADFLMSRAAAACSSWGPSVSGISDVEGLSINGEPISVTGDPNQTVSLPNGKVVINEQASSPDGTAVNALHVLIPGVADVVLSSASAGIGCI